MDILCLQETRWKGNKAKELAGGHKLLYSGNNAGRNGVAVILLVNIRENLIGVERRSDRVMSIKLRLDDTTLNVISAYAPQVGCLDEEKDQFWDEVDQVLYLIPQEKVILAGDLNRHVGQSREGIKRWHGGWGIGEKNSDGQRILDYMISQDMVVLNTFFEKRRNQLVTYNSGGRMSQIDFSSLQMGKFKRHQRLLSGEWREYSHPTLVSNVEHESYNIKEE